VTELWTEAAFLAEVSDWVDARLGELGRARTGPVEQPHVRSWSTVLRVPTEDGPVWFKANTPALAHEVLVVDRASQRVPARVPALLACDLPRGWMLMADAGERLREVVERERSLARWHDVLSGVADLHHALEPDVEELVAAGVPGQRLAGLADRYLELVRRLDLEPRFAAATPRLRDLVDELASYAVAETLQHDDLHDGQVFVKDGRNLVLDWGDAVVSHPFFTLSVTLEGGVAWALDDVEGSEDIWPYVESYLARYAPDRPELRDAIPAALRLGWVCRALNNPDVSGVDRTRKRLSMFLDGRPGSFGATPRSTGRSS
jgi:aminoglycoside phosphotransferase (APT) family kinase protein